MSSTTNLAIAMSNLRQISGFKKIIASIFGEYSDFGGCLTVLSSLVQNFSGLKSLPETSGNVGLMKTKW